MTTKEILSDFLKTGQFKNIDINFSRRELTNLLGETEWVHFSGQQKKNPTIIKYDRVEFYFDKDADSKINGIMFQFLSTPADRKNFICDYIQWTEETTLNDVVNLLTSDGIEFQLTTDKYGTTITTESKVKIYFNENNGLQKIGKFIDR